MDFKFTPYKDHIEVIRKYGKRDYPLGQLFAPTPWSSLYLQSAYRGMNEMLGTAKTMGYSEDVIKQLEGYASRLSPNYVPKEIPTIQQVAMGLSNNTITAQANFQKLFREAGEHRQAELRRQSAEKERERATQLEAQRVEVERTENYNSNISSGDLAGPGDEATVVSGGSMNVDASRLSVGSSSRRRRGRGIQSQLGL